MMRSTSVRDLGPSTAMKRPYIPEAAAYGGRMIQPRPEGALLLSPSEPSEPPKKKRGRPTKAEAEERKQAALLRGDPYPTPRRGSTTAAVAGPSTAAIPPSLHVAAAQAAFATAPRATRSPPPRAGSPSAAPSPGRIKHGRPMRAEEDTLRLQESYARAGPSRYPDILSRDDPTETRIHKPNPTMSGMDRPGPP